jgi:cell division protein FtsI (penicillin-binding protein 3)
MAIGRWPVTRRKRGMGDKLKVRRRLLLVGWLLSGGLIVVRATQIQIVQGSLWTEQAERQHRTSVEIAAVRGSVLDRSGVELATSREVFRVSIAPRELRDVDAVTRLLAEILGLEERIVRRATTSSKPWRVLPSTFPPSVREALDGVRGVYLEREHRRFYPQGDLARGLLGSVRDGKALGGVEQTYDEVLRGTVGQAVLARDPTGRPIPGESVIVEGPRGGGQVVLTLDVDLQEIGQQALTEAIRRTEARGGDLLITDPRTGDVLAMVSIHDGSTSALSAINTPYEPGSTIKPLTVAGLLQNRLMSLDDVVDTGSGSWTVAGRTIEDGNREHGPMTLARALQISSSVGVAKAAQAMSPAVQYQNLREFGLGAPTGIGLPGEVRGTLRRPERWSRQSPASLAIGYEISVTPLQMAMAYGALANGGLLMEPRLVKEFRDSRGKVTARFQPRIVRRAVSRRVALEVSAVLVDVVEDGTGTRARLGTFKVAGKSGTARVWADGAYQDGEYFASFVGFFPAEDPQLLVMVKLDRPQGAYYGGSAAAPVTRATMEAILAAQQTPIDRWALAQVARAEEIDAPSRESNGGETALVPRFAELRLDGYSASVGAQGSSVSRWRDSAALENRTHVRVPDVLGLPARAAARRIHEAGLRVEWDGSGVTKTMVPRAGSLLVPGDTVRLASGEGSGDD